MIIKVTKENIENGLQRDCRNCPIALAIFDSTKRIGYVGINCVTIGYDTIRLPFAAQTFRDRFDNGFRVEPFQFELSDGLDP